MNNEDISKLIAQMQTHKITMPIPPLYNQKISRNLFEKTVTRLAQQLKWLIPHNGINTIIGVGDKLSPGNEFGLLAAQAYSKRCLQTNDDVCKFFLRKTEVKIRELEVWEYFEILDSIPPDGCVLAIYSGPYDGYYSYASQFHIFRHEFPEKSGVLILLEAAIKKFCYVDDQLTIDQVEQYIDLAVSAIIEASYSQIGCPTRKD